ncbi:unnamed protein product, partial [Ectocarpus sp. 4 AP-2014]
RAGFFSWTYEPVPSWHPDGELKAWQKPTRFDPRAVVFRNRFDGESSGSPAASGGAIVNRGPDSFHAGENAWTPVPTVNRCFCWTASRHREVWSVRGGERSSITRREASQGADSTAAFFTLQVHACFISSSFSRCPP